MAVAEMSHIDQCSQECGSIANWLLFFCNPLVWIALIWDTATFTYWNALGLVLAAIVGWLTGKSIQFTILRLIPWVFKYLIYRVKLYRWRKKKENETYLERSFGPGAFH